MELDSKAKLALNNMNDQEFVSFLKTISESPKEIRSNHDVRSQREAEKNFSTLLATTIYSTLLSELKKYENVTPSTNNHLLSSEEKLSQLMDLLSELNKNSMNKFIMEDFGKITIGEHGNRHNANSDEIIKSKGMPNFATFTFSDTHKADISKDDMNRFIGMGDFIEPKIMPDHNPCKDPFIKD